MKIYLAGKIGKNDWRHKLVPGLRDDIEGERGWKQTRELPMILEHAEHTYVGPFFISCDHGCYHGTNGHGAMGGYCIGNDGITRTQILAKCRSGIRACDLFVVWAGSDFASAYGTIAEIGLASALAKPIVIIRKSGLPEETFRDIWFPLSLASMTMESPEPVEAVDDLLYLLDKAKGAPETIQGFLQAVDLCYHRPQAEVKRGLLSGISAMTNSGTMPLPKQIQ